MNLPSDYTATYSLYKYLKSILPNDIKVVHGWPDSNENLGEKSISIMKAGDSTQSFISAREVGTEPIDGDEINVMVRYKIAYNDIPIQVDCWGVNKQARSIVASEFRNAFLNDFLTSDNLSTDLSIVLENYFDQIAKYDILSYNEINDEASSQRNEWRTSLKLTCGFDEILEKLMPRMKDIQVDQEITESPIGG